MARRRGLPFLLDFMETARIARFQPRHSFTRELEVRQAQQVKPQPEGCGWRGGYTSVDHGVLSYEYTVPPRLCETENGALSLPILLALCDEVTSWASISADATLRPGVSVVLSAELLRAAPIVASERLRFESKVRKVGKTLSFLDVAVSTEAGEPIAAGRHLKFVDMGLAWNLAFGPRLYPLTRALARATARDPAAPEPDLSPDLATLIDYARETRAHAGRDTVTGRFKCDHRHLNDVGGVHGGYQALMHGYHGDASVVERSPGRAMQLRAMEVTYMAIGKPGTIEARSTPQRAEATSSILTQTSQLVQQATGAVLSEARLEYEEIN